MLAAYPFRVGDELRVSVRASVTTPVTFFARVRYVDGTEDLIEIDITHSAGDRTNEIKRSSDPFKKAGWVEHLTIDTTLADARGRFYMMVAINKKPHHFPIAAGYIDIPHVPLGTFEAARSGRGHLAWRTVADDVAPVDITEPLAVTGALRRVYGFVWYYHSSSDVVSRLLRVFIRAPGIGIPTGFSIDESILLTHSVNLTLTTDQEGIVYSYKSMGGDGVAILNDNTSLSSETTTTQPQLWPLDVLADDLAKIQFEVTDARANDRHSIFILQEEWISP